MYKRSLNEWKGWMRRLAGTDDSNQALARGAAVGFFFGVSIFWGLQIVLAVLAAQLMRGNKVVAAAMTAVSNPLTTVPLYAGCYWVGQRFSGGSAAMPDLSNLQTVEALVSVGREFLWTMFVGTSLVGLAGALAVYLLAERIIPLLRKQIRDGAKYRDAHRGRASSISECP
jgi:uncharacterized protein (DUF2062 family)